MNETLWDIYVRSEQRVVGVDPEWADITNPQGLVLGTVHIVAAEAPDGRRREYDMQFFDQDEAERFSALFDGYDPNHGNWNEAPARYGSDAYEPEMDMDWEECEWRQGCGGF